MNEKREREEVELVNGTVYFSDDNWQTVFRQWRSNRHRWRIVTDKQEADRARFLAIMQAGGGR